MATTTKEDAYKLEVFLPPSHELGRRQIVNLEAPAGCAAGIGIANHHEPVLPARRECRRGFVDPVSIVAKGLMKDGAFSDCTIHLEGEVGTMEREHVGLHGGEQV